MGDGMKELTDDERFDQISAAFNGATPTVDRLRADLADRDKTIAELVAANARMVVRLEGAQEVLTNIAVQPLRGEADKFNYVLDALADWEGGYEGCVNAARKWLEDAK